MHGEKEVLEEAVPFARVVHPFPRVVPLDFLIILLVVNLLLLMSIENKHEKQKQKGMILKLLPGMHIEIK